MTNPKRPIIVAGGGIGGAAAALALAKAGFRVQLIERAPEFGVIGYGIQLGPNVFPMFERLGVAETVLRSAIVPNAVLMMDLVDAGVIASIPTGNSFRQDFGIPISSFTASTCTARCSTRARPTTRSSLSR